MQPRDPDIGDSDDGGPEGPRRQGRLGRDGCVRGPRRDDRDPAPGLGQRPDRDGGAVGVGVGMRRGQLRGNPLVGSGDERGALWLRRTQRGHDAQHLGGCLAGGEDHLGVARPQRPVRVHPGEAQIQVTGVGMRRGGLPPGERRDRQPVERFPG